MEFITGLATILAVAFVIYGFMDFQMTEGNPETFAGNVIFIVFGVSLISAFVYYVLYKGSIYVGSWVLAYF